MTLYNFLQHHRSKQREVLETEVNGKVQKRSMEVYPLYYDREHERIYIRTSQSMKREEVI